MRFLRYVSVLVLLVLSWSLASGGASGCNSNPHGGADDGDYNATEQDAEDTAIAAANVALDAVRAAFGADAALSSGPSVQLDGFKTAFAAESITLCEAGDFPVPSGGSSVRIEGGVGGSCNVAFSGEGAEGIARANCSSYDDGEAGALASFLGLVGVTGDGESFRVSSDSLAITLANDRECTADLNLTLTAVAGTDDFTAEGCVRVCGESYQLSGTETF